MSRLLNLSAFIITEKGNEALIDAISGNPYHFSRLALGDGSWDENTDFTKVMALKQEKQSVAIGYSEKYTESSVLLKVVVSNEELSEGYYIKEIGIFVADQEGNEILYSIATASEKPCYMDKSSEQYPVKLSLSIYQVVNPAAKLTLKINDSGYITPEQLGQELDQYPFVLMDNETIEIPDRKKRFWYLNVTEKATIGAATGQVKVSPNMGIEILN